MTTPETDVHTSHCCKLHGCKYGWEEDGTEHGLRHGMPRPFDHHSNPHHPWKCSVVSGDKPQEIPCGMCPEWSKDWPKTPGFYWLFGFRSKQRAAPTNASDAAKAFFAPKEPELLMVQVVVAGGTTNPHLIYLANGAFMYKEEGGGGFWLAADVPDLPVMPMTHMEPK